MTLQELFDKVALHLLTQNKRSSTFNESGGEECLYHSSDGLSCSVGCLIPKSLYKEHLEGGSVLAPDLSRILKKVIDGYGWEHETLLLSLQSAHDDFDPPFWRDVLVEMAGDFNLEWRF